MNKSEIRKKILIKEKKIRIENFQLDFKDVLKILIKKKNRGKIIGGYYPYNYEIDIMSILEKFEKLNFVITLPKIKKNFDMNFFNGQVKNH